MKTFEIVAGTYEEFLLGYHFNSDVDEPSLTQSFASHDHSGSLRSLATSGRYLASGATDDRIIVYDFKTRKEYGMLTHHKSTINCLRFTKDHSHLVSGSADGVLSIVRVGNWKVEKIWDKAHKGAPIVDIALHSSGKMALTLGTDGSLRTWNLVKGRQAYAINLNTKSKDPKSLEKILWAEDGVRFILYGAKYTEIWSIEIGGTLKVIEHPTKVTSCLWFSNEEILVGYEDGEIALIHIESLKKNKRKAHNTRVKAISRYLNWLVTASSSGDIKVWNNDLIELAKCNSGCRITCLEIVPLIEVKEEEVTEEPEEKQENFRINTKRTVIIEDDDSSSDEELEKTMLKNEVEKPKRKNKSTVKTDEMNKRKNEVVIVENSQSKKKKQKKGVTGNDIPKNVKKLRKKKMT